MGALSDARGESADLSPVQHLQALNQIEVLWITAGLGCDGDTIAMAAATQPSLEDIRTIWAGVGNRLQAFRLSMCQAARFCPIISRRCFSICCIRAAGRAPMIPLDEALRPRWLFGQTVHEGCDRGGYYEQGDFAEEFGAPECIMKLGCWGPVVNCNVGKRGWIGGIGGCPNVGGICIGCTMPGFPDKFMPFMDQLPGSLLSSHAVMTYGRAIKALRKFTQGSLNNEPEWRRPGHGQTFSKNK